MKLTASTLHFIQLISMVVIILSLGITILFHYIYKFKKKHKNKKKEQYQQYQSRMDLYIIDELMFDYNYKQYERKSEFVKKEIEEQREHVTNEEIECLVITKKYSPLAFVDPILRMRNFCFSEQDEIWKATEYSILEYFEKEELNELYEKGYRLTNIVGMNNPDDLTTKIKFEFKKMEGLNE
jgi:hypothetical protein